MDEANRMISRFIGITLVSLMLGTMLGGLPNIDNVKASSSYDRQAAYDYAEKYWDEVCNDGYFWDTASTYTSLSLGTSIVGQAGFDCAHFVSCAIGNEPHESGGGLDVPSRVPPTYGEPGAGRLGDWLLDNGVAEEKSSVDELEMGDVVNYDWDGDGNWDHVAIYLDNGEVAAHTACVWEAEWQLGGAQGYRFIHITTAEPTVIPGPIARDIDDYFWAYVDIGGTDEIVKSLDTEGRTWEITDWSVDADITTADVVDIVCSTVDADVVYVATAAEVYKTEDGGDEWDEVGDFSTVAPATGDISCLAVGWDDDDDPRVFVGTLDQNPAAADNDGANLTGGVYYLYDVPFGADWTDLNVNVNGQTDDLNIYGLGLSPDFADDAFQVAVVADMGATISYVAFHIGSAPGGWEDVKILDDTPGGSFVALGGSDPQFPEDFNGDDFYDGDQEIFVGITGALHTGSGDGGVVRICGVAPEECYEILDDVDDDIISLDLTGDLGDTYLLAGTSDGDVWYSNDDGDSWLQASDEGIQPSGSTNTYVICDDDIADNLTGWAATGGAEGSVSLTTDGGANWRRISLIVVVPSPVLLMHGFQGTGFDLDDVWGEMAEYLTGKDVNKAEDWVWVYDESQPFDPDFAMKRLEGNGLVIYISCYTHETSVGTPLDIRWYAQSLAREIQVIKDEEGVSKVDIVAHSMGGLVARAYIESEDLPNNPYPISYNNDVRKLVMLGTPNQGAYFAILAEYIPEVSDAMLLEIPGWESVQQMDPAISDLFPHLNVGRTGESENVEYSAIAGNKYQCGSLLLPLPALLCTLSGQGDNDGRVTVNHVRLDEIPELRWFVRPLDHNQLRISTGPIVKNILTSPSFSEEPIPVPDLYSATLCSPGELRVYDSQGRVTGLVNGEIREEIPNSTYDDDANTVIIFSTANSYYWEVVGTSEGTYGIDISFVEDGETTTFVATDIPTTAGATHSYTIDWEALSEGEKGVTIEIDSDGDGEFEETILTTPPNTPSNPSPSNGATGISVNADFTWLGGDLDEEDTVTYDVYFGTDENPPLVSESQASNSYRPALDYGNEYYWKVVSRDNHGIATEGPMWNFTTRSRPSGGGGLAPSSPSDTTYVSSIVSSNGVFTKSVTAKSADSMCQLIIDEGTIGLTEDGKPLTEITILEMSEPPAPPGDASVIGLVYNLGPDGASFEPAITLTFTYDPSSIPEGIPEESLSIAYWDTKTESWVKLDSTVDTETKTITVKVRHFTSFAVFAKLPPPPEAPEPMPAPPQEPAVMGPPIFELSQLTVSPAAVGLGEVVTVWAFVTNVGGSEGTYTAVLKINAVEEDRKEITVDAGASQAVRFITTRDTPGTYKVDINGLVDSFVVTEEPAKPIKWPLIGGVIGGSVTASLLVYFLIWRKRRL